MELLAVKLEKKQNGSTEVYAEKKFSVVEGVQTAERTHNLPKPRSSPNRQLNLLAHPFPAKLQSVRYSAAHDDLKPPQTARRHADLLRAHRHLFQTEIPTKEKLCYYKFTRLRAW